MQSSHENLISRLSGWVFPDRSARAGEGLEAAIVSTWPWPAWLLLVLAVGALAASVWLYLREQSEAGRGLKALLVGLRVSAIGLVLLMLCGWMLHRYRTDLPDLVLAIDQSGSMSLVDHPPDESVRSEILRQIQAAGFDQPSRLNQAKSLFLGRDAEVLDQLQQRYNVKLVQLGSAARMLARGEAVADAIARLEPEDTSSRLGDNLRQILEMQRGRSTAAVVLVTDGITTEGPTLSEAADEARRSGVPLYVVALGSEQPPRDIRLADLLVDEVAFVGDLLNFDFNLHASGFDNRQVRLQLRREGSREVLAEKTHTIRPGSGAQSIRLTYRPQEAGDFTFVVEAEPLEGEVDTRNNRLTQHVSVRDEKIRVLFVQENPSFEYRFLKTLLERAEREGAGGLHQSIELTTVLQEADPQYVETDRTAASVFPVRREELFSYDVLIFGDVNRSYLSSSILDNIAEFVEERGGGVVFLAGPRHTPLAYRDTPLARLLPVRLDSVAPSRQTSSSTGFSVSPTPMGLAAPPMQLLDQPEQNATAWQMLPNLYWYLETPDVKPGARVLAQHSTRTGSDGQPLPIITMQYVGAGKVVFHGTDETFRWARFRGSDALYTRYWIQLLRYLSRSKLLGTEREAELVTDRDEYRRGESVQMRLRFFDDRQAPAADDGVVVMLERESGRRRQITMQRDPGRRGVFDASVDGLADGRYRGWLVAPSLEGSPPARRFSVVAPPGEFARLETDTSDLRETAKQSSGQFYTFETARRLVRDLPPGRQVRIDTLPPQPIWNSWLFPFLFLVVLTTEWLLRKRAGML